jgi:hypothetical protein
VLFRFVKLSSVLLRAVQLAVTVTAAAATAAAFTVENESLVRTVTGNRNFCCVGPGDSKPHV